MQNLKEAKEFLRENWMEGDGVDCPCCSQRVKLYRRNITSSMAAGLIVLYKHKTEDPNGWVHIPSLVKQNHLLTGDFAKLKYWGLIVPKDEIRDDGSNRNGYYKITTDGRLFVEGRLQVEKYKFIFNKKVYDTGEVQELIDIHAALKNKFNYNELMQK